MSQIHTVASKYSSAIPAVYARSSSSKLGLECQPPKILSKTTAEDFQYVFVLVPIISHLNGIYSRLKGFTLITKEIDDESVSKKEEKKVQNLSVIFKYLCEKKNNYLASLKIGFNETIIID